MKHHIVRTIAFAILSLGLAAAASAKDHHTCSIANVAGDWGYTKTGTLFHPTAGATPFATMGILTLEKDGNLTGVNTGSVGGVVSRDVLKGTFEVNPDCTGTTNVKVHDGQTGDLLRTIDMDLVVDDDLNQLRGIMTNILLPNGMSLKTVITAEAKRLFQNHGVGK